jgi:hypothetical protein
MEKNALYQKSEVSNMLIKTCFSCNFHQIKKDEEEDKSYCKKENCWSAYSDCISLKALNRFLSEESRSPIALP